MTKNNYLMGQEYMLRLENELLIERIAKIEKELGLKEKEIKELRIQIKMINLAIADVSKTYNMKQFLLSILASFITYNIGYYFGMKKGAEIAKKVYRKIFLK